MRSRLQVVRSDQWNPWLNLAAEDYLLHHANLEAPLLFLFRNQPSIIIGRAQNPFIECQLTQMEADGVLLARRQSGGGTVYHDLGNLNFSFISPKSEYSKDAHFEILLKTLHDLGLPAFRSPRNDLLIHHQGQDLKISGSAFRETKHHAFHHGTLLVNADLSRLRRYLTPTDQAIEAKGVKSVRSSVINLTEIQPGLTVQTVEAALMQALPSFQQTDLFSHPEVLACYEEYASWEWRFGRTLPFTHRVEFPTATVEFSVENGHIQRAELIKGHLADIDSRFLGRRYDQSEFR